MDYQLTNKSLYGFMVENVQKFGDRTMLLNETESYTWSQFFKMYNYFIYKFKSMGIKKGKTVALACERSIDASIIIFALIATEAIIVFTDAQRTVADFLNNTTAKIDIDFVVRHNYFGVLCCESKTGEVVTLNKIDGLEFNERVEAPLECQPKVPAFVFFTSGTSGKSKGVLLTQHGILNNRHQLLINGGSDKDRVMMVMPYHHVFSMVVLFANLSVGATLMFPKNRDPNYILDFIEKYKSTRLDTVPTYFYMLIDLLNKKPRDISSLQTGVIAGGPYTKQQFKFIEDSLNITLSSSYGMTETSTVTACTSSLDPFEVRSLGIGKFIPHTDGVLKDSNGRIITEPYKTGEICIKGFNLMLGYLEPDGSVNLPVDEDGHFHTGDLAEYDEEGYMYVVGRCKEIIIRGGENISPLKIENKIAEIEGVSEACVVGVPSEKYGEEVGVCVVGKGVSEEDIRAYLAPLVKKYEIPTKYVFVDKMPALSGTGKPDKQKIKTMLK